MCKCGGVGHYDKYDSYSSRNMAYTLGHMVLEGWQTGAADMYIKGGVPIDLIIPIVLI